MAMLIGTVIRNEIEDLHVRRIPDSEMKALNTAIRNGAYTVLHAIRSLGGDSDAAAQYLAIVEAMTPKYWEQPRLLRDFTAFVRHTETRTARRARPQPARPSKLRRPKRPHAS